MRKYALIVLPCTLALTLAFILYIFSTAVTPSPVNLSTTLLKI